MNKKKETLNIIKFFARYRIPHSWLLLTFNTEIPTDNHYRFFYISYTLQWCKEIPIP